MREEKWDRLFFFFFFKSFKLYGCWRLYYLCIAVFQQVARHMLYRLVSLSMFSSFSSSDSDRCLVFGIIAGWFQFYAIIFRNGVATVAVCLFSFVSFIFVDQQRMKHLFAGVLFFVHFFFFFQMAWIEWPIERMKNFVEIKRAGKKTLDRWALRL